MDLGDLDHVVDMKMKLTARKETWSIKKQSIDWDARRMGVLLRYEGEVEHTGDMLSTAIACSVGLAHH